MVSLPGSAFANLNSADLSSTRRSSEFANSIIERAEIYDNRTKKEHEPEICAICLWISSDQTRIALYVLLIITVPIELWTI
jgi:hypothetical protein